MFLCKSLGIGPKSRWSSEATRFLDGQLAWRCQPRTSMRTVAATSSTSMTGFSQVRNSIVKGLKLILESYVAVTAALILGVVRRFFPTMNSLAMI